MNRHVYIGSAWPYVNGQLHLGHVAGLLPADFLARFHRLNGDQVLWTSGSDCHGTPITVRAKQEGKSPREVAQYYHNQAVETFGQLGFSYSLYWATMEPKHYERVQASFKLLHDQGLIVEGDFQLARCSSCKANRADREISGQCPFCMDEGARGDQCDNCGEELDPIQLLNPTCAECGSNIEFELSKELFFDLPQLEVQLSAWVNKQPHWRLNAKRWTESWLKEGLKKRPITRKIDWGIPVPIDGWEDRRIYVWFEAVHGYLTASMQWAENQEDPECWKSFWNPDDENVIAYYVIGKDNIPFHTLMWPGILMGRNLALPWHIVSSEYLGLEGQPLSTSKNWAIWAPDFLERYPADYLRYFLAAAGPEKKDTDFTWERFVSRINDELVNNWGNLIQRVLKFVHKRFDGKMPDWLGTDERDQALNDLIESTFIDVAKHIEDTEFQRAIKTVMKAVQATNQYLQERAPWKEIKTDKNRAGVTIAVALNAIASIAILTEPFMPFQAKKLQGLLGGMGDRTWKQYVLHAGHPIFQLDSFFEKLDTSVVQAELDRLEAQKTE